MSALEPGWTAFLTLFLIGAAMNAPWRIIGVWLARDINAQSEIFLWVKAVSTALVASLIGRMVVFPSGVLAAVPMEIRTMAFVTGIAVYYLCGKRLALGVMASVVAMLLAGTIWPA